MIGKTSCIRILLLIFDTVLPGTRDHSITGDQAFCSVTMNLVPLVSGPLTVTVPL
ncbi:MAG: hypothetical protein ACFFD4_35295 [Candidatus Odinarchaeota archaeon]